MKTNSFVFLFSISILVSFLIFQFGCKKDDNNGDNDDSNKYLPVLTTKTVEFITQSSAFTGGKIISDGGSVIIESGVCWHTTQTPTIENNKKPNESISVDYQSFLIGLSTNTIYYVRAYATNANGISYGNIISFTTLPDGDTITDIDGNIYHTVTIGTQVWMIENLKVTRYRNGDQIPNISDSAEWLNQTYIESGAYCNYNNDTNFINSYGRLYNYYAVTDIRKIAPEGWHVPNKAEWQLLIDFLGGYEGGGKLKEIGINHWQSPNTGATNQSSFYGLPGGFRHPNYCTFHDLGYHGYWWSYLNSYYNNVCFHLYYDQEYCTWFMPQMPSFGLSVRCLKD